MPYWISLPTEILENIFRQFETKPVRIPETIANKQIQIFTKDVLQLQLTCKSWSSAAQSIIYRCAALRNVSKLDKFIRTLINSDTGVLVEKIYICFEADPPELLVSPVTSIAQHCPNLKILCTNDFIVDILWEVIERERSRGFFTKLEVMPILNHYSNNDISMVKYNAAAFRLRQTLREVVIYDMNEVLYEDRLLDFPNIDTVCFDFTKYNNIYTVDQQMKNHLSIEAVNICFEDNERYITVNDTHRNVISHACSQIKRLRVESPLFTRRLFSYIMQVFPNLQNIVLFQNRYRDDEILLPLAEAAQLFYYLMKIRNADALFHFSGTQDDFMLHIYDQNNKIQHLCLRYESQDVSSSVDIRIKKLTKVKLCVELTSAEGATATLPRTSLIEKSGCNLLYLDIDMTIKEEIEMDRNGDITLFDILRHCSNLRGFSIVNTLLHNFGVGFQLKERVYEKVTFEGGYFVDRDQSSSILRDTSIKYVDIFMPYTKFNTDDLSVYYLGKEGRFEKCPLLLEPLSSEIDKAALCISIECIDVRRITIVFNTRDWVPNIKYSIDFPL
ncbi:hypothetical protein INT48_005877 [Thamnidium elegans]|uniref:F-box domain-containing protein n=1 Tax=Thamnidium elegans TaxID=101142 RepID=A0A8H7SHB7_9FUNG|nr:hypothetical protein INT48_005877 [Thamnidium elegans]